MKYFVIAAMLVTGAMGATVGIQAQDEVLTAIGDLRRGEFVTIEGTVTRIRDYDEFRMEDGTGRVDIYVRGGMRRPAFRTGDTVIVRGWVDDDLVDIPREVYASEIELEDGTIIEVHGGAWD